MRVNEFGTFGICLDAHSRDTFEGRMYVSVYEEARPFKSMSGLINEMNGALEFTGVPHPFCEFRTFASAPPKSGGHAEKGNLKQYDHGRFSGKEATFLIKVLYRQNATWQGTVTWVEEDRTVNFRSALELFVLIESTLCH